MECNLAKSTTILKKYLLFDLITKFLGVYLTDM